MKINGYNSPKHKNAQTYTRYKVWGHLLIERKERGMAAIASAASSSNTSLEAEQIKADLRKQIRSHEVAIAELNSLSSSQAVYQKNMNILFRTSIPKATVNEQKQLDLAKAKLQKLN